MRAMKDSGIEWIGGIPDNWGISPLRSKFSFGKGLSITKADLSEAGVPVISYGQIHSKDNTGVSAHESLIRYLPKDHESLSQTSLALNGDFIFADTSEDLQGCGNCVYVDKEYPIYAGYHTLIVRPKSNNTGKFYAYLFTCDAWRAQVRANVSGVKLYSVTQDILKRTYLLDPPIDEQTRIVQYLDQKCADIDLLIKAKEKTNALLKERRQSIIYEAVTKGLDPTVPMKDSGVEWIGEIPERWRTGKTVYALSMPITDGPHETPELLSEGIPFVSAEAVSAGNGSIDFEHIRGYISKEYYDECCKKYTPQKNDIYMIKSGATTGKVALVDTDRVFTIWSPLAAFRCDKSRCHYRYLFYFLQSDCYQKQVENKWSYGTQQNIGMDILEKLMICFPEIQEQIEISDYLDKTCQDIDKLVSANEQIINKLKEYRQSLIYEVVTGKIEV